MSAIRLRARLLPSLCAAVALFAPQAVASPPGPDEELPTDVLISDWQIGPFYARPTLEIRDLGYDSNPFHQGESTSDVTLGVFPGLRLALPFDENLFTISQKVGYSFFRDASDRRQWSFLTDIGLSVLLGPLQIDLNESFSRTDLPYGVERLTRPLRRDNQFRSVVTSDREAGVYLEGSFSHRIVRFEEDQPDVEGLLDQNERTVIVGRAGLFADVIEPARLLVGGQIDDYDFRSGDPSRDATGYFVYGGFRLAPGRALTGTVRVGFRTLEIGTDTAPEHDGLGVDVTLGMTLGPDVQLGFTASRANDYTEAGARYFGLATRYGATLRFPVTAALSLELGGALDQLDFPTSTEVTDFDGTYDYRSGSASLLIPFADDLVLAVGGKYQELESNTDLGYDSLAATIGLRYGL